jgi:2',3'-cyclic-nucleotide 2'-phosphodiesterase (5'-nucleotidase family)
VTFLRPLPLLLLLVTAGCAPRAMSPAAGPPPAVTLSIVGTNDLHGGMLQRGNRGGLALLGGYVANLRAVRARDGGAVVLIDAGDMFQGTLESNVTEGAAVVAAYNALGYAAAAIGNHEFDFGPVGPSATARTPSDDPRGALKARAAQATFPFLAANLLDAATGRPVDWPHVRPSVIVTAAGVRVGIIGIITREALTATIAANVVGLAVAPLAETIVREASALRAKGAAAVIVTAHAGGRCSRFDQPDDLTSCEPSSEIFTVARALPAGAVDAIVAGHTHAGLAHEVGAIPIIESLAGGRAFGRVDLRVDRAANRVVAHQLFPPRDLCAREDPATHGCEPNAAEATLVAAVYEGAPVAPDQAIDRVLAPAMAEVAALKARPLGVVLETPVRRLLPESPLGNLFTDAMLASVPGADVSLHNSSGGLRADLPAGPLTYGSVFEVMPFDNVVVPLRLSGRQLTQVLINHFQRTRRLLGFSGIRVRTHCADGAVDVDVTRPSGARIGEDESLVVVVSDFLATGGDGILTPVTPHGGFALPDSAPLVRDVVADYLTRRGGPLREAELVDPKSPRLSVAGELPVSCPQ